MGVYLPLDAADSWASQITHRADTSVERRHPASVTSLLLHQAYLQIQELQQKLQQMNQLAHEDPLTGALNRRGLDTVLARELSRAERQKAPLSVAMLDIDDFKKINDGHGHHVGDQLLVHLAKLVTRTLRQSDAIGRFGGEEFLIVLPDTSLEHAVDTLARVQRILEDSPLTVGQADIALRFSAGVTSLQSGENSQALIQRADEGTYQAKRNGKNCLVHSR